MIWGDFIFADVGVIGHRGEVVGVVQQAVGGGECPVTILIAGEKLFRDEDLVEEFGGVRGGCGSSGAYRGCVLPG